MTRRLYLTTDEVRLLLQATSFSRYSIRDRCMILMTYLHGLRVSELINLRLSDIDSSGERIFIRRLKNGFCTTHPVQEEEKVMINKWLDVKEQYSSDYNGLLFVTRKGNHISRQQVYKLFRQYGQQAGLGIDVHPHMLRHACGYELAEQGLDTRLIQDYLGHRNIRHTVHYTAGNAERFSKVWAKNTFIHVPEDDFSGIPLSC